MKTVVNVAFKDILYINTVTGRDNFPCRLTQRLYPLSLLAASLAAGLTADVVKGEEDVVFLMHVDRQLNLYLYTVEQVTV